MERKPAVSGQFYPGTKTALETELQALIKPAAKKESVLGIISPHAGYIYSGKVAGEVFSQANLNNKTFVILGPNHTGIGHTFSIMDKGSWLTPLGSVPVNQKLAGEMIKQFPGLVIDETAHAHEHSLEVQIPFLQYLVKDFNFVPIVIAGAALGIYQQLGKGIAQAISACAQDTVIIASSDMTHYETQELAEKNDHIAIAAILKLDEAQLLQKIQEHNISMCGWAPVITMLVACKQLGAKTAKLIKYQTSGEASGDYSSVVGYAGVHVM